MANSICYGDLVYLELDKCLLFSNGFFDSDVYFVSKANACLKAFKFGLFRILPCFSYQDTHQVDQLKDQLNLFKSLNPAAEVAYNELNSDLKEEEKASNARYGKLDLLNDKIYNELKGKPIVYGDKIQLLHLESQSFLTPSKASNSKDKAMVNLELVKKGHKDLYFKFTSSTIFSQKLDFVEYDTPLQVICLKTDSPIVLGDALSPEVINKELNLQSNVLMNDNNILAAIRPKRKEPVFQHQEVYNSGLKTVKVPSNIQIRKYLSFNDKEKFLKKNVLHNGDYVRLTNDKVYLTIYPKRGDCADHVWFQSYGEHQSQRCNYLNTLFQIIEAPDTTPNEDEKTQKSDPNLPKGNVLEYNENRKYILKHVITGKILTCQNSALCLQPRENISQDIEKVSVIMKTRPQENVKERYLDRNTFIQLKFYASNGADQGTLSIGKAITGIYCKNYDLEKVYYCGYLLTEDSLNDRLRTERFTTLVSPTPDDKSSSFKFLKVTHEEITSIFFVESVLNQFTKFFDFLDPFLKSPTPSFKTFNEEVAKVHKVCETFERQLYEEPYNEIDQSALTPNKLHQILLRECYIYDMFYRIYLYIAREPALGNKAAEIAQKIAADTTSLSQIDDRETINTSFENCIKLFGIIKKMMFFSFKKNRYNRAYTSQFAKIFLACLFGVAPNEGLFRLAPFKTRMKTKEITLALATKGLWELDIDALDKIGPYKNLIVTRIYEQFSYHTHYLKIVEHVFRTRCPDFDDMIRPVIVKDLLSTPGHLEHLFPSIVEENNKILISFKRFKFPDNNYTIDLEELDEGLINSEIDENLEKDKIRATTAYLVASLRFMNALMLEKSFLLNLKVISYYKYETLVKAIQIIRNSPQHREIRQNMSELLNSVHQRFFTVPFIRLPRRLQLFNEDSSMNRHLKDLDLFIINAVNTNLSEKEAEHLANQDLTGIIEPLKKVIASDKDLTELIRQLKSGLSIQKIAETNLVLDEMEKLLEITPDLDFTFLQLAHNVTLNVILEATSQKKASYFALLQKALGVFSLIEDKLISHASVDILERLECNKFFEVKSNKKLKKEKSGDSDYSPDISGSPTSLRLLSKKKIAPEKVKPESTFPSQLQMVVASNAIFDLSKEWKTGQKLYALLDIANNVTFSFSNESANKFFNRSRVINALLEISILNDYQLLSTAIQELKKMSSYESILYTELSKLTFVHDAPTLAKASELIKLTFRINEINREVFFCQNSNVAIEESRMNEFFDEIAEHLWKMFFAIYDVNKHFRYPDPTTTPEQRFKDSFVRIKKPKWTMWFKHNPKAINKSFQKIFTSLKIYQTLLNMIEWVEKSGILKERQFPVGRLFLLIFCVYLNENKEAQDIISDSKEFILLFFSDDLVDVSADSIKVCVDLLRGNKRLQKLPTKSLYETIQAIVLQRFKAKIVNDQQRNNVSVSINSYDCLNTCLIPNNEYHQLTDMKNRWQELSLVQNFTSLNVLNYNQDTKTLPNCYYSINETMSMTLKTIENLAENIKQIDELQLLLPFSTWLGFFESENYFLQYDLKNLLTQSICKIFFEYGKQGKFLQKFEEYSSIISCLFSDLLFFRKYISTKQNQDSVKLHDLLRITNFITTHESYNKVKTLYDKTSEIDFESKKLPIFYEEISLHNLLYEYIYGGCLDLLFNLLLQEVDFCAQVVDKKAQIKSIMDFVLLFFEDFIKFESTNENFPREKIERFLNEASVTKGFSAYREKIMDLTNMLLNHTNKGFTLKIQEKAASEVTPLDIYNQHLVSLNKAMRRLKEHNIQEIAKSISDHPMSKSIIQVIISYLKRDISKINKGEIKFSLKLLRKFIEIENSNNPKGDPTYKWKDVNLLNLKKISKIQNIYQEMGLTEILYKFLLVKDQKIFRETILLSLAYLYGGHLDAQQEFFTKFTDDESNKVIDLLSNKLTFTWDRFKEGEKKKMQNLYKQVQKNLFEYLKDKPSMRFLNEEQLQEKAFEINGEGKYIKFKEAEKENEEIMLILSFLQFLCEGQYTNMQKFLREQKWQGVICSNSFNFLAFLRDCIYSYHKIMNKHNLSIGRQVMELITELIQGDVTDNIRVFLDKTFIYDMCRIITDYNSRYHTLPRGFGHDAFQGDLKAIKGQVIFMFKTMLENRNVDNLTVLSKHLDTVGLMYAFESLMENFLTKRNLHKKLIDAKRFALKLTNEDFKDTLGDAINIYIIFRYLWEDQNIFTNKMRDLIGRMNKSSQGFLEKIIFVVFKKLVANIEIMVHTKSDPLIKVMFPVLAVCNYMTPDAKTNFLDNVNRDNSQTKLMALINSSQEFIHQMYVERKARNTAFGLNLNNLFSFCRILTNIVAVAVTILNISTYEFLDEEATQKEDYTKGARILNSVQIILASFLLTIWLIFIRGRHQSIMWERYVDHNVKTMGALHSSIKHKVENADYDELEEDDCRFIMMLKGSNSDEFKQMRLHAKNFKYILKSYYLLNLLFIVKSKDLIWRIIYLIVTISSLFHPIVAIFQIFDIVIRSDTIRHITSAISRNARQFIWTLFLLVIVNIVYSSVGFFFLNDSFVSDENKLCDTAFSCFMNTLNLGLRSGGGIGDAIEPQPYANGVVDKFVLRILFDLSFFIIMITLLLNLIFGMIIDAFGDLRDKKTDNEEDQRNICFICGIERSEFERHISFEDHIHTEHDIWAYLYYIVYLLERQKTSKVEMTDIEHLVLDKYLQKDLSWFPIGHSWTLERIYEKEKLNNENELEYLTKKVEMIQNDISQIDSNLGNKLEQIITNKIQTETRSIIQRETSLVIQKETGTILQRENSHINNNVKDLDNKIEMILTMMQKLEAKQPEANSNQTEIKKQEEKPEEKPKETVFTS